MPNAAAAAVSEPISFADPVLAGNLDELLGLELLLDVQVERYAGRYDIVFQKGNAALLVTVFFASKTYRVGGGTDPVSAHSREDVWDAASVFSTVKCFLTTLNVLGVRDSQEVVPVVIHRRPR